MTRRHRVIVLGGLAVIAHGFSRSTFDGDIWLDPMGSSSEWSDFLEKACIEFGGLTLHRLPGWIPVSGQDLVDAVDETHMIRIQGLDCPLMCFENPTKSKSPTLTRFVSERPYAETAHCFLTLLI